MKNADSGSTPPVDRVLADPRPAVDGISWSGRPPRTEVLPDRTCPPDQATLPQAPQPDQSRSLRLAGDASRCDEYALRLPVEGETLDGIDWAARTSFATAPGGTDASKGSPSSPRVGRFKLLERIGAGGFGEVWRAFDPRLQREVAIKLSHISSFDAGGPERMLHEARSAGRLRHPAIVAVYEEGLEGDVAYVVSEYVHGTTLDRKLQSGPLSPREAAGLARMLAEALAHAHDRGIVHRDVKPSNVLLDLAGRPHLADFGIARRAAGDKTISQIGQALGTPAYMSPEQAMGDTAAVGPRSDVYSLGLVLYEMLTGRRAYPGDAGEALRSALRGSPPSLRSITPTLPRDLTRIVDFAIAREQHDRYPTVVAMADDLADYLDGKAIRNRYVGLVERIRRRLGNFRLTTAGVGGAALALTIPLWWTDPKPDDEPPPQVAAAPPHLIPAQAHAARPAYRPATRSVLIETVPSHATVRFFLLDPLTGRVDSTSGRPVTVISPGRIDLVPGEYFVTAELPDGWFNETTRWIPYSSELGPLSNDNLWWEQHDGKVKLKSIPIPPPFAGPPLVFVPEISKYVTAAYPWRPARECEIPAFWMMSTEFGVEHLRKVPGGLFADMLARQPADHQAALLRYDEAVTVLERAGFRLPTAEEWEYAARWSEPDWQAMQSEVPADLEGFGPLGVPASDRSGPGGKIGGLRSGAPEWVASWGHDASRDAGESTTDFSNAFEPTTPIVLFNDLDPRSNRVVRGGGDDVQTGNPNVTEATRDPGLRSLVNRFDRRRRIGFRGVRSASPHRTIEDFVQDRGSIHLRRRPDDELRRNGE